MHIPDGYLSPQTSLVLGLGMLPVWAAASAKLKKQLQVKQVPLLALGAAFSFVIMLFNIPVPDGTTAHAVGGTLLAIVLGPWAAVVSLTITLVIQALLFGDGGVLAIGANCFNIAFVLPFVGYYVYHMLKGNGPVTSSRYLFAAGIAAFVAINAAALVAALEFGLQPVLFHTANGTPLYCPYYPGQALLAMMFAHLLVAGPVEAVVTVLVLAYLQKAHTDLLAGAGMSLPSDGGMKHA